MAQEATQPFYYTKAWKQCREAYRKYQGGLCEVCRAKGLIVPGEIVHHKIHLDASNINNPNITLNFDNLQLVCRKCHGEIHGGAVRRYKVQPNGEIVCI